MTSERLDVLCPTPPNKEGKSFLRRIGTAWATRNGGWQVIFEALPLPVINDKGQLETKVVLMPPREDNRQSSGGGGDQSGGVPF